MDDFDPNSTGAKLRRVADRKIDDLGMSHVDLRARIEGVDGRVKDLEGKVNGVITTQAVHEEIFRRADLDRKLVLDWQQINGPKIETASRSTAMAARLMWILLGAAVTGGTSFFVLLLTGTFKKWLHLP
jgi:hypothetical protein